MLSLTLTARALRRKVRTHEAEPYRVNIRDVLPLVPPERRADAALLMQLHPFAVEAVSRDHGEALPVLACTPLKFGPRWWFMCPRCERRRSALYWLGYRDAGGWACRVCLGLKYTSSATHRTTQGDWDAVATGPVRSWAAYQRASKRQRQRYVRLCRKVGL